MNNLKTTTDLVKHILETVPETRNNHMLLYHKVCERLNKDVLESPFGPVLLNMHTYGIPAFETVRRTRQKVQQHHPDLSASDQVKRQRWQQEEVFRNYARGCV